MCRNCKDRSGMTLVELLIATTIMVMVMGTLAALSDGVQRAFEFNQGHSTATQHARVVLDRIARTVRGATANEQFPGMIVVAGEAGSWRFPDTLVVWHPDGAAADPDGLPRYDELTIYTADPSAPNQLVEITLPGDTRTVPAVDDEASWLAQVQAARSNGSAEVVVLTDLLRSFPIRGNGPTAWHGAVRFETRLRPSADHWAAYGDRSIDWEDLPWVQGIHGPNTGLRQSWVRTELQLMPGGDAVAQRAESIQPITFLGSAALYYELHP